MAFSRKDYDIIFQDHNHQKAIYNFSDSRYVDDEVDGYTRQERCTVFNLSSISQ